MDPSAAQHRARRSWAWALAGIALAGLLLRLWLAQGDLWLDEIWSWNFARTLRSPWDVWRLAHDNNHPLNTLWMWCVGDVGTALPYRALAFASGSLAIVFAGLLGARSGRFAGGAAALLVASSTLLAYYSSEARGYAPALACALGGWLALERALAEPRWRWIVAWWLCVLLGLSAHFTFVFAWAALALASSVALARGPQAIEVKLRRVCALQFVPFVAIGAVYLGFVRGMDYGGGDAWSWGAIWIQGGSWSFGLPEERAYAIAASALCLLALASEIADVRSRASGRWIVFAAVLLLPVGITAGILHPQFVALRYFLVPLAFVPVFLALALARLSERGALARVGAIALLAGIAGLNLLRCVELARAGRGRYAEALRFVLAESSTPTVRLASDLEFDTRMTVEYHARALPPGKRIAWFQLQKPPPEGLDWLILTERSAALRSLPFVLQGQKYAFARGFGGAGPSAYTWDLYRRVP